MHGDTVSYAFTGWRRAEHWLHANDLIQWEKIHEARNRGFRYYDFGEVDTGQTGLAQYKSKWGAEARRLYRYYYPSPHGSSPSAIAVPGPLKQLYRSAPLAVSVLVGEWLYRYL
jgi:lipid II:glycine glycyltransferase (peptidoglycan interpeptide bridge formation enzyme)